MKGQIPPHGTKSTLRNLTSAPLETIRLEKSSVGLINRFRNYDVKNTANTYGIRCDKAGSLFILTVTRTDFIVNVQYRATTAWALYGGSQVKGLATSIFLA